MRITEIYNLDIYGDNGQYLGEVRDAIIDLEKGEVSRLLMEEWRNSDRVESKRLLQNRSILFKNIRNIGDVVLVTAQGQAQANAQQDTGSSPELTDLASRR